MQAIKTTYLGPTNSRGSRIKAVSESGESITVPYPHERSQGADAHSVAAIALCKKLGWDGDLVSGSLKDGYVFVFADSERFLVNLTEQERAEADRIR